MGNGWPKNTQLEERKVFYNQSCSKSSQIRNTQSVHRQSAHKTNPKVALNSTFPEFIPRQFQVDVSATEVNVNNQMKRKSRKSIMKSRLFIFGPNNARYLMQFRASNPDFTFLNVSDRITFEPQETRSTQAYAVEKFVATDNSRLSCKFFNKEFVATSREPKKRPKKPTLTYDEHSESQIYISKDGVEFILSFKGDLTVTSQFMYDAPFNRFGWCRASLLMKIMPEGDVCRVSFDIKDLDFANVTLRRSRGCQTTDPFTYYKTRGATNSPMYVPVPLSTYFYRDPMVSIRLRNHQQWLKGIEPDWMAEVRRERICRQRKLKSDSSYPGSLVSNFIIERGGYIFKACTGILRAKLLRGFSQYDEFVRKHFSEKETSPEQFYDPLLLKV